MGFQTIINNVFISTIILLIFSFAFGFGGGFALAYNLGKFMAAIPIWIYGTIGGLWVLAHLRN